MISSNRHGAYALIGLGMMICYVPVQMALAKTSSIFFREKASLVDARVKLSNDMIEGIRLIKMYAWEEAFRYFISTIRTKELKKILLI